MVTIIAEQAPKYLYLIQQSSTPLAFKIGVSVDPLKRLRRFQTGNPFTLTLVAAFRGHEVDEWALHDHFSKERMHGEWFVLNPRDLEAIVNYFEEKGVKNAVRVIEEPAPPRMPLKPHGKGITARSGRWVKRQTVYFNDIETAQAFEEECRLLGVTMSDQIEALVVAWTKHRLTRKGQ